MTALGRQHHFAPPVAALEQLTDASRVTSVEAQIELSQSESS